MTLKVEWCNCDRCGKRDCFIRHYGNYNEYILCSDCAIKWSEYFYKHMFKAYKEMQKGNLSMDEWTNIWYKHFKKFLNEGKKVKLTFT